jgi:UTP:GlnB (protein PII) uridylyltransferase
MSSRCAVVALGHGASQPFSDVDLLFLHRIAWLASPGAAGRVRTA